MFQWDNGTDQPYIITTLGWVTGAGNPGGELEGGVNRVLREGLPEKMTFEHRGQAWGESCPEVQGGTVWQRKCSVKTLGETCLGVAGAARRAAGWRRVSQE